MLRNTVKALSRLNNMNFHLFTHLSLQTMPQVSRASQTEKARFHTETAFALQMQKERAARLNCPLFSFDLLFVRRLIVSAAAAAVRTVAAAAARLLDEHRACREEHDRCYDNSKNKSKNQRTSMQYGGLFYINDAHMYCSNCDCCDSYENGCSCREYDVISPSYYKDI